MFLLEPFARKIKSFMQNISKKAYRECAVIMAGTVVLSLVAFHSNGYNGAGKNAVAERGITAVSPNMEENCEEEDSTTELVALAYTDLDDEYHINRLNKEMEEAKNVGTDSEEAKIMKVQAAVHSGGEEVQKQEIKNIEEVQVTEEIPNNRIQLSDENYEVLCRIVEAEATGEGKEGKKLVANVILNRVASETFPGSVKAVVFQGSGKDAQFTPTKDGRYYDVSITGETIEAVECVLDGEDNSMGALYFSARNKSNPNDMSWFDRNLTKLFSYGNHEFYR